MSRPVTLETIKEAAVTLKGIIRRTPVFECVGMSEITCSEVYFKMENLQKTGSFKIRGAVNKIASLTAEEKARGVIASSAGNHAQGVALGAKAQGIKATIVMPGTAPMAKVAATKGYGAEVVLHGEVYDDAYAKACEIQKESGAVFLHPFDDEYVISGQGTIALEILEDLPNVDVLVAPIGGGGILAGIAKAAKSINPNIRVIGVQTANVPSMQEALKVGESVAINAIPTIADGIAVKKAGLKTFEIIKECVDEVITVTEDEIANAILYMMEKNKVVAEGAGATAAAAILAGKVVAPGKVVCGVVSGGNVDINLVDRIVNKALFNAGRRFEFKVKVADKVGEVVRISDVIKNSKANILFMTASRYHNTLSINSQVLEYVVECIDMAHRDKLVSLLQEAGCELLAD